MRPLNPRGSVLVVDDHTDSRDMLSEFLKFAGFDVSTAATGDEAVARAQHLRPHVVFMDLSMPGLDGYEATRRIKQAPDLAGTVVFALTANALPRAKQLALAAGCDDVFVKPCDVAALAVHVYRIVNSGVAQSPSQPPRGQTPGEFVDGD